MSAATAAESSSKSMTTATSSITLSSLMQPGNTAVVTGASSGIGKAASLAFALKGMNVWMIDLDQADLVRAQKVVKQTALEQFQKTQQTQTQPLIVAEVLDVSDPIQMELLATQVWDAVGHCHILMNNAGTGMTAGTAIQMDVELMDRIMRVNTYGPIYGCQAFLPKMMQQQSQTQQSCLIINTGSKQGITCPPGNEVYNMSKVALKVYTEGLEHELSVKRRQGNCSVRACLLIPGWVHTSIQYKAQRDNNKAIKAEDDKKDSEPDDNSIVAEETTSPSSSFQYEDSTPVPAGAWLAQQVIDFMIQEIDAGKFYILCPDNEVSTELDHLRMAWAMQDITQERPPRSRWHPDFAAPFQDYLADAAAKKEPGE